MKKTPPGWYRVLPKSNEHDFFFDAIDCTYLTVHRSVLHLATKDGGEFLATKRWVSTSKRARAQLKKFDV